MPEKEKPPARPVDVYYAKEMFWDNKILPERAFYDIISVVGININRERDTD